MQPSGDEAKWISDYLEEEAQKPVLSELGMGKLREEYFVRYRNEALPAFNEFKKTRLYIRSSERVAKHLENNPNILIRGKKRGKTYRHKDSRPRLTDQMVAKIIPPILLSLRDEVTWNQLHNPLRRWIELLHISFEKHPDFLDQLGNPEITDETSKQIFSINRETMMPTLIDGEKTIQLGLKMEKPESKEYRKKFPADLREWLWNAYDNDWWIKSSSNIQSIIKKEGKAGPGSKRGTWLHSEHRSDYGSMLFFDSPKENPHPIWRGNRKLDSTKISKQISTQITILDGVLSELISSREGLLRQDADFFTLEQNIGVLKSEIRQLADISDRITLLTTRIARFRKQLAELAPD